MEKIFEEKGISIDVVNLSNVIADKILQEAPKCRKQISDITSSVFVEGSFTQNIYGEINGISELNVYYILYFFDNIWEYNQWLKTSKPNDEIKHYNSWSDYDTHKIQIVSAYIDGKILNDFTEDILHEVAHLFQYGNGMQKRVNLYDNVINMCSSNNKIAVDVAKSVYYTFKHEQDAMVHQFYGFLIREKPFGNVDYILNQSEYGNALDCLENIIDNKEEAKKYIKQLGFTAGEWNKRIHFGYKRFKQKLYNAYLKYKNDSAKVIKTNESKTFEINLKNVFSFDNYITEIKQRYGQIEIKTEAIYNF